MDDIFMYNSIEHIKKCIKEFNEKEYNDFIFKVYVSGKNEMLEKALINKKKKIRCLRTLDNCLARRSKGKPFDSNWELEFVQKFTVDGLPNLIHQESRKFGVNVLRPGFYVYYLGIISELKQSYENETLDVFEQNAKKALQGSDNYYSYKADFIKIFVNNPQYGLQWAKQLKIKNKKLPDFVRELESKPKSKKNKTRQKSKKALVLSKATQPIISLSECLKFTIIGHRVFTVQTQEEFKAFIHVHLINLRNGVFGIDCEADPRNELALIQIAAKNPSTAWICLFDVLALSTNLPEWKILFEHIFNSNFECVGFAFEHDYAYLYKTFPSLSPVLQSVKVLCLKKLSEAIMKDPKAKMEVFGNKEVQCVSLANLSETIIGIHLNKEMQRSDWTTRPLTEDQKIYAALDAAVLVKIKEKIDGAIMSNTERIAVMNMGYFHGEIVISKTMVANFRSMQITASDNNICCNLKKCKSTNTTRIPSPLYFLIYKLAKIQKCIFDCVSDWQMFENDAMDVKNMKPIDYDGLNYEIKFGISKKPSRSLTIHFKEYIIKPLISQVSSKVDGRLLTLRLPKKQMPQTSKPGISYILCLKCGNTFLEKENAIANKMISAMISQIADLKTLQEEAVIRLRNIFA